MAFKPVFIAGKFDFYEIISFFHPVKLEIYDNKFDSVDMMLEKVVSFYENDEAICKPAFPFVNRCSFCRKRFLLCKRKMQFAKAERFCERQNLRGISLYYFRRKKKIVVSITTSQYNNSLRPEGYNLWIVRELSKVPPEFAEFEFGLILGCL